MLDLIYTPEDINLIGNRATHPPILMSTQTIRIIYIYIYKKANQKKTLTLFTTTKQIKTTTITSIIPCFTFTGTDAIR